MQYHRTMLGPPVESVGPVATTMSASTHGAARRWYKGELHFHCERSTMPEMLAAYRRRRYDFCVSTEHDAVHQRAPYCGPDGLCHPTGGAGADRPLLLVGGSEMSLTIPGAAADGAGATTGKPVHVGAFPLRAPVEKHAPTWPIFGQLRQLARPPLIVVNHPLAGAPERHWSADDVCAAIGHGATHLELNPRNHGIEGGLGLWDAVLSRGAARLRRPDQRRARGGEHRTLWRDAGAGRGAYDRGHCGGAATGRVLRPRIGLPGAAESRAARRPGDHSRRH